MNPWMKSERWSHIAPESCIATMCRAGYGLAGPGLVSIDRAHEITRPSCTSAAAAGASSEMKFEGAELVVVTPTPPLGVGGAPTVVLVRGGWRAVLDAHAQTVTLRLRSPLVGYDPFSVEVMTDPYPVYRDLRPRRVLRLPEYDASALTRFDDVWRVLTDRERFSIFEGPVFHREAMLRHHDGPPDPTVIRPVPTFSMLDPPVHTQLRQALLGPVPPARRCLPLEDTVRQFARARLDALAARDEFDVRHDYASPVAAQVAALQLGFPVEDAELLVGWVNAFVAREPGRRRHQRGGPGGARRAARVPRRPGGGAARHP